MIGLTKSFWGSLCVVAAVIVGIPAVAQAQPEGVYDFTAPPGDQGTDATFGSDPAGGGDITASGFTDPAQLNGKCPDILPPNRACLFVTDDLGLGIKDPANQNRITSNDFVQLDLINLKIPPLTSPRLSFRADGIINNGVWEVFGSNEAGTFDCEGCAFIMSGTTSDLVPDLGEDIIGVFRYLDITAASGGVLLNEIDASFIPTVIVPEPTSLALLGAGIIGLGLLFHRRRASTRRPALQ